MAPTQSRVAQLFPWLSSPAVRMGLRVGVLLSVILSAWLILANRVHALERFAMERNAVTMGLFLLVAVVPIARFRSSPWYLAISGVIGWAINCFCYFVWTIYFDLLSGRMGAFRVFVMGAAIYGLAAVMMWIGNLIHGVWHQHLTVAPVPRRRIP